MTARADLTDKVFGRLVAKRYLRSENGHAAWECLCECGTATTATATHLKTGHTTSCGCANKAALKSRLIDLSGQRFGRLVVIRFYERKNRTTYFECLCDCGRLTVAPSNALRRGGKKSCGCLWKESISRHGLCRSPEYVCWTNIIQRCLNPRHRQFPDYGGRGISICEQWRGESGFKAFLAYVGRRPNKHYSLDRENNNRGYEPGNVRWATLPVQLANRRSTRWVEFGGKRMLASEFADGIKLSRASVYRYLKAGKTPEWIAGR